MLEIPIKVKNMGHYFLNIVEFRGCRGELACDRSVPATMVGWTFPEKTSGSLVWGNIFALRRGWDVRLPPHPLTSSACKAVTRGDVRDGGLSHKEETIMSLGVNWGHASAQQSPQELGNPEGGNLHLLRHADTVSEHC